MGLHPAACALDLTLEQEPNPGDSGPHSSQEGNDCRKQQESQPKKTCGPAMHLTFHMARQGDSMPHALDGTRINTHVCGHSFFHDTLKWSSKS